LESELIVNIPDKKDRDNNKALLNEEKGNLFEFLVAHLLSLKFKIEESFYNELNADLKNKLAIYEDSLRANNPQMIPLLFTLAQETSQKIEEFIFSKNFSLQQIYLIGKLNTNNAKGEWNEADFLLKTKNNELIPISLKLTKENSFMNTKSAGAKSFIERYFKIFENASALQEILNKEIEQAFSQMTHKLYQLANIDFVGKFDFSWKEKWSELPGELPVEFREVIFINYHRVASLIHQQLVHLQTTHPEKFRDSLAPLCGMGDKKMLQVSCYHQEHRLKLILIRDFNDFFKNQNRIKIGELKKNMSSFDIIFGDTILQIRVKPMNKFTTAAYKINCSIKLVKDK